MKPWNPPFPSGRDLLRDPRRQPGANECSQCSSRPAVRPGYFRFNRWGTRAKGLYPKELTQYEIFGDPVYSSCTGKVIEVRDDLSDLTTPEIPNNPEGNHVTPICDGDDARILLAHLQRGSVSVKKGENVKEGQRIGQVGNSGNTSEPHLHIHAERDGTGVPLRFD